MCLASVNVSFLGVYTLGRMISTAKHTMHSIILILRIDNKAVQFISTWAISLFEILVSVDALGILNFLSSTMRKAMGL